MLEPGSSLAGNLFAHGVHKSKWFGKCVFNLKKWFVVRKLLHRKVWKVLFFHPKRQCGRWCTTAVRSILRFHPYKLVRIANICFSGAENSHVGDVALLAFRQYFDSSPKNFIECQQPHAEWAGEERTAFLFVFFKSEQQQSRKIACFCVWFSATMCGNVKLLQRDEFCESTAAAWYEGGS